MTQAESKSNPVETQDKYRVLVVDDDVDVQDLADVTLKLLNHIDPERDIQFTRGPMDDLEDASDLPAYGSKMGIDATRKGPSEGFVRPWPTRIRTTPEAAQRAEEIWDRIRQGWNPNGRKPRE